ncbi:hypothetical protein ACHAXT_012780 [Thalassiosira profunda]
MVRGASSPSTVLAASVAALLFCAATGFAAGRRRGRVEGARPMKIIDGDGDGEGTADVDVTANNGRRDDDEATKAKGTANTSNRPPPPPSDFTSLPIHPVGTLSSIYRLCVGTPRQGMLAPHSRGVLTFDETKVSKDAVLELQHYSHVFVVFVFHLNSNGKVWEDRFGGDGKTKNQRQFPSKIAPPSLGGKKVGVFSTRTPHRPNPIGFSLCKLDKVIVHNEKKRKGDRSKKDGSGGTFSLLLSGLDIVDGTPVLDVKPYVPHYDAVGYQPYGTLRAPSTMGSEDASSNNGAASEENAPDKVRVPHWVESGLQKRRKVTFLPEAEWFLHDLSVISAAPSMSELQFYGPHSPWKETPEQAKENLKQCILELLGVDVRSAWQTKKARRGKFRAERSGRLKDWKASSGESGESLDANGGSGEEESDVNSGGKLCTQQIDNLLVKFTIEEPGSDLREDVDGVRASVDERSMGSGAEDVVVVHSISLI